MSALLRNCPECGSGWPSGPDHALRGMGWLQGLARSVSPTNGDVDIHDYHHGGRFLRFEVKRRGEEWPPQRGQLWTLQAIAANPKWTVRILRGDTRSVEVYPVTENGVRIDSPIVTHVEAVRRAVDAWLRGSLWRDAEEILRSSPAGAPVDRVPAPGHVCGWARVDGVWTCVGDYYAAGRAQQDATACGKTLPEFSTPAHDAPVGAAPVGSPLAPVPAGSSAHRAATARPGADAG